MKINPLQGCSRASLRAYWLFGLNSLCCRRWWIRSRHHGTEGPINFISAGFSRNCNLMYGTIRVAIIGMHLLPLTKHDFNKNNPSGKETKFWEKCLRNVFHACSSSASRYGACPQRHGRGRQSPMAARKMLHRPKRFWIWPLQALTMILLPSKAKVLTWTMRIPVRTNFPLVLRLEMGEIPHLARRSPCENRKT